MEVNERSEISSSNNFQASPAKAMNQNELIVISYQLSLV